MKKEMLWDLFKKTGKIEYYLKYKEEEKKEGKQLDLCEGIILREQPYGETSKILQVLTKEYGLIGIMAKGVRSIKSSNRSASVKLTYGKFHIYYKKDKLSTLKSVDVINPLKTIKTDLTRISYATFLLELTEQVVRQTNEEGIFDILLQALLRIDEGQDSQVIINIVELKYLAYLGVMPILDCCSICGSRTSIVTLSASSGGYVCKNCHTNQPLVSEKSIKLIRLFNYVDLEKVTKTDVSDEVKKQINLFLDEYYELYTGLYLKSKSFLKNLKGT